MQERFSPQKDPSWIFPWGCETGWWGAEGAAKETKTTEGIKCDKCNTGQNVSVIVPVRGANLQVVQTKVINCKCNYEREKCKTTKRAVLPFDLWVQSHSLTPISSTLIFFVHLHCSISPIKLPPVCMLTSQYGVTQRTERLELKKNLRGRAQSRWEKPCNTSLRKAPLYTPFYTQAAFSSILPGYSARPCKECHQLGKYWADFLNQARTSKKTLAGLTSPNRDHNSHSIFMCTLLNPICFQCNYVQKYSHRRV